MAQKNFSQELKRLSSKVKIVKIRWHSVTTMLKRLSTVRR